MKTSQSLKIIYDLDEVLDRIPLSDLIQDLKDKYPERYELIIETSKFLLTSTICSVKDINSTRKTQLLSMPQPAMQQFLIKELEGIGETLQFFEEPLKNCIAKALLSHKKLMEYLIINKHEDDAIIEDIKYEYRSWRVLLVWQFTVHLYFIKPKQFDAFSFKVQLSKERGLREGAKKLFFFQNSLINNYKSQGIEPAFDYNPLRDKVVSNLRTAIRLLWEHQILSEYSYYLSLDESLKYEDFMIGKIPKTPNDSKICTGFKTTLSEPQKIKLYEALKGDYIDCSKADFIAMFTDNPKPIKWKSGKALLAFFVSDMFQKRNPNNYWIKAESIFIDDSNKHYTSLRQSFHTAYNNDKSKPKNYQQLKNIYNHLL
jgi:hypothetical protein